MTLVVIPARLDSRRLPSKMLRPIGERTLIEWTWRAACRTGFPVLIATDSDDIASRARSFGARVCMTGPARNGTERCAEVSRALVPVEIVSAVLSMTEDPPDVVINWQGDSPLTPPTVAHALCRALEREPDLAVATPVRLVTEVAPGQSVAVFNADGRALLFTRQPLAGPGPHWAHVGLYAYRAAALERYGTTPSALEEAEQLEQIRWLALGERVGCVPVDCGEIPEVNEPGDLEIVGRALAA